MSAAAEANSVRITDYHCSITPVTRLVTFD